MTHRKRPRSTRVIANKVYRACPCGETAHDGGLKRLPNGEWRHVYACRNCRAEIVGPVAWTVQVPQ